MSQIYFTADLHLGHDLVATDRGYQDTADHDNHIINEIEQLPAGSTLWILGDLDRGSEHDHALQALDHIACNVRLQLVAGNHDASHPMHRRAHLYQRKYMRVFHSVQQSAKIRHNNREVLLSHFPYEGDHTDEPRYNQWRLRDYGQPLVHGHTHQATPTHPDRPNQVCVSWDAWGRPAQLDEVMKAMVSTK